MPVVPISPMAFDDSMKRVKIVTVIALSAIVVSVGHVSRRQSRNNAALSRAHSNEAPTDCKQIDNWHYLRISTYAPVKTTYMVISEVCPSSDDTLRVRITDPSFETVLFEYVDDSIVRTEQLDLLGDRAPQLLVVTASAGTGDEVEWHLLSESDGKLREWKWPELDSLGVNLLRKDEDFCCKEWRFHLRHSDVFLVRGIYRTGEGNGCPSRGGVLAKMRLTKGEIKVASVVRISKPEFEKWTWKPFCSGCPLVSTE